MSSKNSLPTNPIFSSFGVVNVLGALNSKGRSSGSAHFPKIDGWTAENNRVKSVDKNLIRLDEDSKNLKVILQTWFRNLIGEEATARKRIDACGIDENIACLAAVKWDADILNFCRMQILITQDGNLMDFYCGKKSDVTAVYYRLELDPNEPGSMFTEPQPHIHTVPKGSPRFPFLSPKDEFLPLAFLEFIYLNHKPEKWRAWACEVCKFKKPTLEFGAIAQAYDETGRLWNARDSFRSDLNELKAILGSVKRDEVRKIPKLSPDLNLLNYWPASAGTA